MLTFILGAVIGIAVFVSLSLYLFLKNFRGF